MSKGDQLTIVRLCKSLFIPCIKYEPAPEVCADCQKLEKEVIELKAKIEAVRSDYVSMLDKATAETAEVVADLNEMQKECNSRQTEITLLKATNMTLTAELEDAQNKAAALMVETANLKKENEQHIISVANLERAREELVAENSKLCSEIEQLKGGQTQHNCVVSLLEKILKWLKGE